MEWPDGYFWEEANCEWAVGPGYLFLEAPTYDYLVTDLVSGLDAAVVSADINGDGFVDIFYGTSDPGGIGWFENLDGGSTWAEELIISSGPASHVDAADVDGDGDQDLLVAHAGTNAITWFENTTGTGYFWAERSVTPAPGGPLRLCGFDLEPDGDCDLLCFGDDQTIVWFENLDGSGMSWTRHDIWAFASDAGMSWVEPCEIDGDSHPEVMCSLEEDGDLGWLDYQPGPGTWSYNSIYNSMAHHWTCIDNGDIDGDGDEDAVACRYVAGSFGRYLYWFENNEPGGWDQHSIHQSNWDIGDYVRVEDIDDDGSPDVLISGTDSEVVEAWLQGAPGGYDWYRRRFEENVIAHCVTAGDFDYDGLPEPATIISDASSGTIEWYDPTFGGYPTAGSLTTSIFIVPFGAARYLVQWGTMMWEAVLPAGTSVGFQIRASADSSDMGAWSDTIWVNGTALTPLLPDDGIYVQCIAHLQTTNPDVTPVIEWFCAEGWVPGSAEEEEGDPLLSLGTVPNPSIGPPVFRVSLPEAGEVALSVFDMLGRLVGARDLGVLQEGVTQHQPFDFPSGLYFARMDTPGGSASCRFVVVRN